MKTSKKLAVAAGALGAAALLSSPLLAESTPLVKPLMEQLQASD